ncbi:MurR/RpiR family transcriptional regulator [Lachnospiraceae bacterium 62-35]
MFFTKLKSLYPTLTYSETKIADYILVNKDETFDMTSQELADLLGISQSTAIRFSQKMGYKSFKNMILDLSRSGNENDIQEIQLKDSTAATNEKIKNHFSTLIDVACDTNPPSLIDEAVEAIYQAPVVFCFGYLATSAMAIHMNWTLTELGIMSFFEENPFALMTRLKFCPKNSLLIIFSKSGETQAVINVAKVAKEAGLCTLGITNMAKNSLQPYLDIWLKTMYSPTKTRFLSYTELSSHLYLINVLILNLYKKDFSKFKHAVTQYQEIAKPK